MKSKIMEDAVKLYYYVRREGCVKLLKRGVRAVFPGTADYPHWKEKHRLSTGILERQRAVSRGWSLAIDVCCPAERTLLKKSLERQTADIGHIYKDIRSGKGEFILLAGSDILLASNAFYEFGCYIKDHPDVDWFYCDHDIAGQFPVFKPDFNRNYLLSYPYIGEMIIVRRNFLESVMRNDKDFPGRNFYEIQLALSSSSEKIGHIAKILYHLKKYPKTADREDQKVLENYLRGQGIHCKVSEGIAPGTFDVDYQIRDNPLISVIIPNKDHCDDLKKCLQSIQKQTYRNVEILIVENRSEDPKVFKLYRQLRQCYDNIRVLHWDKPFNYSALNNFAAQFCSGEYFLFLNNDVEFISERSIERMLQIGQQAGTGAVGAKLLYPDGRIQHAGVIVGYGGIAGHAFLGCDPSGHGYMSRIDCVQNYSAVTAACMLVKKNAFEECGGFDEKLQVAFNDVDFCLRLRQRGYDIVYTPYACAWHFESGTRGREDTLEKMRRFNREVDLFCGRWKKVIRQGDLPIILICLWNDGIFQ